MKEENNNTQKTPRYNLNNFDNRNDISFNNVNVTFVNSLRNPILAGNINKTVHDIPSCFGRTTASFSNKHTTKDLKLCELGQYEHLVRNRLGIRPLVGSVIFETTLRNYKKNRSNSLPPQQIISKKKRSMTNHIESNIKDPYIQITEKNMSTFAHCLKEGNQGTVTPAEIQWILTLKTQRKMIDQKKK